MKKCIICNKEIDDFVSKCPYCQGEQKEYDNDIFNMNSSKTSSQVKRKKELLNEAETFKLFEYEKNIDGTYSIIKLKNNNIYNVNIPEGVVAINNNAFENSKVMEVVLPEGLIELGDGAFKNCANLEKVNIPSTLKFIGNETFLDCPLLDIVIPETVIRKGNNFLKGTLAEKREAEIKRQEEARKKEQEEARLAKIKAEEEERKKEQERQARIKAEEEAKQKEIEEERKKEQERRAKIKAEEEARQKEIEEERKKEQERHALEQEVIRKHEEKIREAKRLAEEQEIKKQQDLKEAQNIDETILNLNSSHRSSFWSEDVVKLYERVNKNYDVRTKCKNLHILEEMYNLAKDIRKGAELNKTILELKRTSIHNKDWCNKVIEIYYDVNSYASHISNYSQYNDLYTTAKNELSEINKNEEIQRQRDAEKAKIEAEEARLKAIEADKARKAREKKAKIKKMINATWKTALYVILIFASLLVGILNKELRAECLVAAAGLVCSFILVMVLDDSDSHNQIYFCANILIIVLCGVFAFLSTELRVCGLILSTIGFITSLIVVKRWAYDYEVLPSHSYCCLHASLIVVLVGLFFNSWACVLIIGGGLLVIWGLYTLVDRSYTKEQGTTYNYGRAQKTITYYGNKTFNIIIIIIFAILGIVLSFISRELSVLAIILGVIACIVAYCPMIDMPGYIILAVSAFALIIFLCVHTTKDYSIKDGVLRTYRGRETEVVIPDGVTAIQYHAFLRNKTAESIVIPEGVTMIGENAFDGCKKLTDITIPSTVTVISKNAFNECFELENVYISSIEAWCNISFGNAYANPFQYAENIYLNGELLTDIVIPDSITEIKAYSFGSLSNIINITLPKTIINVGEDSFINTSNLENVYYQGTIENWCDINFDGSYSNPLMYAKNFNMLNENNEYYKVTEVRIPDSISIVKPYIFCGAKLDSIIISENVSIINQYAFAYNNIKLIQLPEKLVTIGDRAFFGCNLLEYVYIGENIKTIGESAFRDTNLLEITYNGTQRQWTYNVDKYSKSKLINDKKPWDHKQTNYKMKYLK